MGGAMHPVPRRRTLLAFGVTVLAAPALAQSTFPDRPIRVLVPWTPGGATDLQMRAACDAASRALGVPVIVENRPGASGTLAPLTLAREARPDGYTLAQMPAAVFRMPHMVARPGWDPRTDFTWIIRLVGYMGGIVVRPDAPWRTLGELLDAARAAPGAITYGTPGANTTEVQMRGLARAADVDMLAVPFRGAAPNLQALLGRQIHCSAETSAWADMVLEGQLRLLAVWTAERAARFPTVPTLRELGYDVLGENTYGVAGPRGLEPAVARTLHDAFRNALDDPAHRAVLARFDMPVRYLGSEGYAADAVRRYEEEGRTVRELGLRLG